jgi:hypothetical protein
MKQNPADDLRNGYGRKGRNAPGSDAAVFVFIPRRLAVRVEAFASQNGTETDRVVIEAIDTFLRSRSAAACR